MYLNEFYIRTLLYIQRYIYYRIYRRGARDLLIDGGMSAAMSYGSDLTGDIRNGPRCCRADGIRVASVGPADGLQYWDHTCPGAHALDAVELTVVGARSTIKQSSPPPPATYSSEERVQHTKTASKKNVEKKVCVCVRVGVGPRRLFIIIIIR